MSLNNNEAAKKAAEDIGTTIIKLKKLLEDSLVLRVECAKLEFDMLGLYNKICLEELEGLRDERENDIEIPENTEDQQAGHS